MKYRAISRIFLGLILLFFNINIRHLNLLTTFLGALLILTATWQLRPVDRYFKYAYRFGIVQVVLQAGNVLLLCAQMSGLQISVLYAGVSTVNMIALMYSLFWGLSQMALAQGQELLGGKLKRCYKLYAASAIAVIGVMVVPPAVFIAVPAVLVIFVYILVQVSRLDRVLEDGAAGAPEKPLNPRFFAVLSAFLCLTAALCLTVLLLKNAPGVPAEVYNPHDRPEQTEIGGIRSAMLNAGFEEAVLNDLPDSEIGKYQDVLSVQNSVFRQQTDGGTLEITKSVSAFENGKIRLLFYYKWAADPVHHYCDRLSTTLPLGLFVLPNNQDYAGFGLYDRKTESGTVTYKADFIKDGTPSTRGSIPNSELIYRVFGGGAANQRGFFAFNALVASPGVEMYYNTGVTLLHQRSLLNFGDTEGGGTRLGQMTIRNPNPAYDSVQYLFEDLYKP